VGSGLVLMTVLVVAVVVMGALAGAAVVTLALVAVGACVVCLPLLASCGSPNGPLRDRVMPQSSRCFFHTCMRTTLMPFLARKF
jgi:hypothetical protein